MRFIKTFACSAILLSAGLVPSAAIADDVRYFDDGNGNCGYMSCNAYGCQVIDQEYCPNEVGEHG